MCSSSIDRITNTTSGYLECALWWFRGGLEWFGVVWVGLGCFHGPRVKWVGASTLTGVVLCLSSSRTTGSSGVYMLSLALDQQNINIRQSLGSLKNSHAVITCILEFKCKTWTRGSMNLYRSPVLFGPMASEKNCEGFFEPMGANVCLVFLSVHYSLVVTCWEGLTSWLFCMWCFIDLLSLSHVVSWIRCGAWLYWFLIFVFFLTLSEHPLDPPPPPLYLESSQQMSLRKACSNTKTFPHHKLLHTLKCILLLICF